MADWPGAGRMDLLLWRHAEAEEGEDDLARPLTERGRRQAKAMAAWIRAHQPKGLRILVSPAARARQTATALQLPFEIEGRIAPEACASDLIAASGWPGGGGAVLLVGHQPALGRLAALVLAGFEAGWSIRKGALWWLSRRIRGGDAQCVLRAVIAPDGLGPYPEL